jgi:hypothetical protein
MDLLAHIKDMLKRYDVGDKVSPQDSAVLKDLLARHPNAVQKIGSGIKDFSVRMSGEFGSKCFWVNRTDGTTEDFSFKGCIYG